MSSVLYQKIISPWEGKTGEEGLVTVRECGAGRRSRSSKCAPLWDECLDQWEGRNRRLGKTACTAAIISPSSGREWQRFITRLSKCIIERVTSSTGALGCTDNTQARHRWIYLSWNLGKRRGSWLTCTRKGSVHWDSYNLKTCRQQSSPS